MIKTKEQQMFIDAIANLKASSISKLKEVNKIDFSYLLNEILDEDGEIDEYDDERPQIIVADKHGNIEWTPVISASWDENRREIMVDCESDGIIPLNYAEGLTENYVYIEILRYFEREN